MAMLSTKLGFVLVQSISNLCAMLYPDMGRIPSYENRYLFFVHLFGICKCKSNNNVLIPLVFYIFFPFCCMIIKNQKEIKFMT